MRYGEFGGLSPRAERPTPRPMRSLPLRRRRACSPASGGTLDDEPLRCRKRKGGGWRQWQSSVIGAFGLLDELPDFVVVESRAAQGPRLDAVRRKRSGFHANVQARSQNSVYDLLERLAGFARFGAQLGRHIVVEG